MANTFRPKKHVKCPKCGWTGIRARLGRKCPRCRFWHPKEARPVGRCHYCEERREGQSMPFVDDRNRFVCDVCRERQENDIAQEQDPD